VRIGKPATLLELQDLISTLDQRYWERQSEISRDKQSTTNQSTLNTNKASSFDNRSDNRSDNRTNNQNSSGTKTGNNQNNNTHSKNKDQKKPTPPVNTPSSSSDTKPNSIADMLGPDSKLKPEERQRCLDNNLCLCCAKFGHTVPNCPIQSKAKPKG